MNIYNGYNIDSHLISFPSFYFTAFSLVIIYLQYLRYSMISQGPLDMTGCNTFSALYIGLRERAVSKNCDDSFEIFRSPSKQIITKIRNGSSGYVIKTDL